MSYKEMTPREIYRKLVEVNEGYFLRFGSENLKKMAYDMADDDIHPAWRFF